MSYDKPWHLPRAVASFVMVFCMDPLRLGLSVNVGPLPGELGTLPEGLGDRPGDPGALRGDLGTRPGDVGTVPADWVVSDSGAGSEGPSDLFEISALPSSVAEIKDLS